MSTFVRKSHNVSVLMYHLVCGAKYRRAVFDPAVADLAKPNHERELTADLESGEFYDYATGEVQGRYN